MKNYRMATLSICPRLWGSGTSEGASGPPSVLPRYHGAYDKWGVSPRLRCISLLMVLLTLK
jgi:hypothetical protein